MLLFISKFFSWKMTFRNWPPPMITLFVFSAKAENNSPTMKKRLAETLTTIRKRIRPVSEVFTNLKKRSNLKVAKSTESLVGGIMSPFSKKTSTPSANSHEKSINDFHDIDEIQAEIEKVEKEDAALQKMQSVYL